MPRAIPVALRLCWTDPVTGETRSVPLEGALRFGSDRRQNDVVLPLRSVEPFHAEILGDRDGGWELVSLGLRRLKVNDSMMARAQLSAGTEFSVGPVAFRVRPAEIPSSRPVSSPGSRRAFELPPPPPRTTPAQWPLAAGVFLVATTAVATWSALRHRAPDPAGASPKATAPHTAPPGPARAKARVAARPAPLEAGSLTLPAPADEPREASAGAVTVLVRLAGAFLPARGFFVTAGGHLVTNQRLVAIAESILVRPPNSEPVPARLVASDTALDLALLEAAVTGPVPVARLDDDEAMRRAASSLGVPASDLRAFVASHR